MVNYNAISNKTMCLWLLINKPQFKLLESCLSSSCDLRLINYSFLFDMDIFCVLDIDECVTGTHNCSSTQTCFNTQGGFRCLSFTCPENYRKVSDTWVITFTNHNYNCIHSYSNYSNFLLYLLYIMRNIIDIDMNCILARIKSKYALYLFFF